MLTFGDDDFKAQIESDTGLRPRWAPSTAVRGFVYDVATGELREVQREK